MQRFEPPLTRTVFVRLVSNERHPPWTAEETFEALSRLYPDTVLDVRSYRDHKESQLVTFATVADAKRAIDDFKWERERERERDRGTASTSSTAYSTSLSAALSALRVGFLSMERRLARRWLWLGGLQVHDEDPEDKGRNPRKLEGEVRDRLRRKVFEELWKRIDGRDGFLEKGLSSPPQFFVRLGLHGVFLSFRKIEEAAKTAERLLTMNGINTNTGQFTGGVPADLDIKIVMNDRVVAEWRRMSVDFCEEADVDVQPSDLQNQPHELDDDFRRPDEPYRDRDQRGHDDYHRDRSDRHRLQDDYSRSYRSDSAGDSWGRRSGSDSLTPKRRNSPEPDDEYQRVKRLRGSHSRSPPRNRSRSPPSRSPRGSRHSPTPPSHPIAYSQPSQRSRSPPPLSWAARGDIPTVAQLHERVRVLEATVASLHQLVHSLTNNGISTSINPNQNSNGSDPSASVSDVKLLKTELTTTSGPAATVPPTITAAIAPSEPQPNSAEVTNGATH